jgi:hypothetical protein
MTDKPMPNSGLQNAGRSSHIQPISLGVNNRAETESLFRRPIQPIDTHRSSENLKTSFTRFAAPKQGFYRRQLRKTAPFGQSGTMPQRRMSDFTRKQQIQVCRAGILVSDNLFLPKMDR